MQKFCDYIEKGYKFFFYLSGLFLGGMFIFCAYSVITRLIGNPSIWADELIRFLMVFMAFAGAPGHPADHRPGAARGLPAR